MQKFLATLIIFAAYSAAIQAKELTKETAKACLFEGTITMMGTTTEVKDCLQNKNAEPEKFIQACDSIAEMGKGLTKLADSSAPEPKVTYLSECPKPAQASCDTGMIAFYYKRDAEMLASTKKSCDFHRGKWVQ